MSFNKSDLAFDDVKEAFDRALASPRGIRIPCSTRGEAVILRSRFNYFRKQDRIKNLNTYAQDHPLYGRSAYDKLILRINSKGSPDQNILYIQPHSFGDLIIEEL